MKQYLLLKNVHEKQELIWEKKGGDKAYEFKEEIQKYVIKR